MISIGIIGCGYWGAHLVRNFSTTDNCIVKVVSDSNEKRLQFLRENYENIYVTPDCTQVLDDPDVDAVVIATPPSSHYELGRGSLVNRKHTFVEKPLALRTSQAYELVEMADAVGKVLMVGHTVIYNNGISMVKEIISSGEIGEVYYAYASRLNLGKVRSDVNVMWNLAPHDISVLAYILDKKPLTVSARGYSYIQSNIEDVVYLNIGFEGNLNAQIHLSWLDPNKKREITIVGSRKMLVYDDMSNERIKIYDKGIEKHGKNQQLEEYKDFGEYSLIHRAGDVVSPRIKINEPLKTECQHFIDCIIERKEPVTGGRSAINVIKVLEGAEHSLKNSGIEVNLNSIK